MGTPPDIRRVPARQLRRYFNDNHFAARAERGDLVTMIARDGHPAAERSGQPYCTRSQILYYIDQHGIRVAVVHRYLRPDGTIGGSGRPDPKMILVDSEIWIADAAPGES